MAGEWSKVRVEDIAEKIAMGPFGSNIKVETFVDDGIPVISGAHLHGARVEDGNFNFITQDHAERLKNSNVFRGDVIFTHAGNIGQVAYIPKNSQYERYVISQRQFYLRCKTDIADPAFITYFFNSDEGQHKLLANASQTGVPSIARPSSYLKTIELLLPPLAEQRAIAHILSTLDDKIELNRKQNETLEAMARALFKAWFVDFEPVRAKMEGRWQRGQSLPGLPAHLYDLFPGRLVESESGEIPEGWTIARAGEIYDVGIGKTPPRKEFHWFSENPKDIPWMSIKDLGNSGAYISEVSEYLTAEAVERFRVRRIPANTVVLSFKLTVGRVAITDSEMLSNEAIAHFIPKEGNRVSAPYLYCYLKQFDYGSLGSTSSIATAVNSNGVRSIPILVPNEVIGEAFEESVNKSFAQIRSMQRESHSLAQLRNTLLPKLISGELRVPNAERIVSGLAQ